ncbi:DNA-binding transcriptional regulator, GntR family [Ralstonia sp. 25mfcol4.1]|uniref:GntR family transcriptional regulator n=1 Tax=Ralstonia sp. 25mfcol4.1 TaxID=1761899 RepID=UPI00088D6D26|nr:GntR family transcriptional regulator [Ralstonia sp. 25mfcol4.1]SDP60371.1 DNA-binding transcriptional regulator, GntR family [Ralstonia sp. 25mfcol4.1]
MSSLSNAMSSSSPFASIEAIDLVAAVEAQLTQAIIEGRLPPGSRIVEADIARRMNVSRAPVREAARRLERQGVLVAKPRHGFAVRTVTVREIDDLFQVRLNMELMAASLACAQASDAGLDQLIAMVDDMVRDAESLPQIERVARDLAFHTAICELSGNAYLHRVFSQMLTEIRMVVAVIDSVYHDPRAVAETHRPIAMALRTRDVDATTSALRFHIEDGWKHVRNVFMTKHGADQAPTMESVL